MLKTFKKNYKEKKILSRNTVIDSSKCVLCGRCVDICPKICLKIMDIQFFCEINTEKKMEKSVQNSEDRTVILKNENQCNRCGLCIQHCLARAINLQHNLRTNDLV